MTKDEALKERKQLLAKEPLKFTKLTEKESEKLKKERRI